MLPIMADSISPLFVDLGAPKPTTREIAATVKTGGIDALTEAERRADQARYQEVTCRSALNPVQRMPFNWTLNPYPGTAHPLQRPGAGGELVAAGVDAGVLMSRFVPRFSSSRSRLERTIRVIADHGARFVGCNVMYRQHGTRSAFISFLEREFP